MVLSATGAIVARHLDRRAGRGTLTAFGGLGEGKMARSKLRMRFRPFSAFAARLPSRSALLSGRAGARRDLAGEEFLAVGPATIAATCRPAIIMPALDRIIANFRTKEFRFWNSRIAHRRLREYPRDRHHAVGGAIDSAALLQRHGRHQ